MTERDVYVLVTTDGTIVGASVADGRPTELSFLSGFKRGHTIHRVRGPVVLSKNLADYEPVAKATE